MGGALNLHTVVDALHSKLDYFVLYSTIACSLGNASQSAYVAANAGAESVMRLLREQGVPAQSIQWSALRVGTVVDRNLAQMIQARGMPVLEEEEIKRGFECFFEQKATQIVVARLQPDLLAKSVLWPNPALRLFVRLACPDAVNNPQPAASAYTDEEMFHRVADLVRLSPPDIKDTETMLKVYALYKQALFGDNPEKAPIWPLSATPTKANAWRGLKGMTKEVAQRDYVSLLRGHGVQWPLEQNQENQEPSLKRARC